MKNYVKDGQKLPIFGVGPILITALGAVSVLAVLLCCYVLKAGTLTGGWAVLFRAVGAALMALGAVIWFIGAVKSDMDASIAENRLKTDGIYAWVRNPMYTGWWFLIVGVSLLWHNAWVLLAVPVQWLILTATLRRTEEKWLLDVYGQAYAEYKKRVNRCIPWPPRKEK